MLTQFISILKKELHKTKQSLERTLCEQTGISVQKREELVGRYLQLKDIWLTIDRLAKIDTEELADAADAADAPDPQDEDERDGTVAPTRRPPRINNRPRQQARAGSWGNE